MKKYFLAAATVLLLTGYTSMAQNDNSSQKENAGSSESKKFGDYDEIIIKRKNRDANEKLTIEINDDKVTVNGKPIDDFVDDDISVRTHSPKHYNLTGPSSPFRYPGGTWLQDDNEDPGVSQPFLGVMTEGSSGGTRIVSVTENSAAAKAGLKKDDIITKINDKSVSDHEQLSQAIGELKPEEKVAITYKRDGKENKTTAVLGSRTVTRTFRRQFMDPHEPNAPMPPMELNFDDLGRSFNFDSKPRIGIKAQDTEDGKGVKVLGVDEGSAAGKAGIKPNDLITSFDGKDVNSAGELAEASRASKDKSSVKVQLKRNGKTQDIELKVPKKLRTANL